MEDQWLSQQKVGLGTEKDADVLRETLLETSPWLLGLHCCVVHSISLIFATSLSLLYLSPVISLSLHLGFRVNLPCEPQSYRFLRSFPKFIHSSVYSTLLHMRRLFLSFLLQASPCSYLCCTWSSTCSPSKTIFSSGERRRIWKA